MKGICSQGSALGRSILFFLYMQAEEKLTEFQAHEDCVSSCGFLHNDSIIMTASFDKTIAFWVSCLMLDH